MISITIAGHTIKLAGKTRLVLMHVGDFGDETPYELMVTPDSLGLTKFKERDPKTSQGPTKRRKTLSCQNNQFR